MLGIILSRSFAFSRNFYLLGGFPVHQVIGRRKRSSHLSFTLKEGKEENLMRVDTVFAISLSFKDSDFKHPHFKWQKYMYSLNVMLKSYLKYVPLIFQIFHILTPSRSLILKFYNCWKN